MAGEAELAAGAPFGALVNDAADGAGASRVPDSVQHQLSDRPLAVVALGGRFVIDCGSEAIERSAGGMCTILPTLPAAAGVTGYRFYLSSAAV